MSRSFILVALILAGCPLTRSVDGGLRQVDGGVVNCGEDDNPHPTFDRSCSEPSDCAKINVTLDCCGTILVHGVRTAIAGTAQEQANECASSFPECGCDRQYDYADDGTESTDFSSAVVACVGGTCTTTFP